ncbi:MAG: helix-turn-helix domain-containing protein [Clostridiales Family XIII bacterium]|jgi:two-component system response regulator YesN|nr:helix-turn-helix domain-containing protein [Clostridiales Family XIII bacterium]
MYKVLIADDEMKVCRLIEGLVSWDALGLKVVACVNDGSSALKAIDEMRPDIVITDIRMPGYNGIDMIRSARGANPNIEFIIISGYKNFDYAHDAIKLGVYDYLLKPLKKNEFESTLTKVTGRLDSRDRRIGEMLDIREQLRNEQNRLRSTFVAERLLRVGPEAENMSLERVNREYHLAFADGCFQTLIIKIDMGYKESNENINALAVSKCLKIAENNLNGVCREMVTHVAGTDIYCVLNYDEEVKPSLRKSFKLILDGIRGLNELFINFTVTLGLGSAGARLEHAGTSLKEARQAVNSRITQGGGRIIEAARLASVSHSKVRGRLLTPAAVKGFGALIAALDGDGLRAWFDDLLKSAEALEENDGNIMLAICAEIVDMYLFNLRKANMDIQGKTGFLSAFNEKLQKCGSIRELFEMTSEEILTQVRVITAERLYVETKPIRAAKEYISRNYHSALTLDEVSGYVGFNATYFSHLFKKVTGMNFLEYLTEVRVDKAKALLIDTEHSVADISVQVGYNDIKHFSKLFRKTTGLSPSEYRKFYQ